MKFFSIMTIRICRMSPNLFPRKYLMPTEKATGKFHRQESVTLKFPSDKLCGAF